MASEVRKTSRFFPESILARGGGMRFFGGVLFVSGPLFFLLTVQICSAYSVENLSVSL